MVGICAYMGNDISSLIKADSLLSKETDKLRNDHARVSIVDLNNCIISKVVKIASLGNCLIQNQLCSVAYHEILLVNTKLASVLIAVIRVQEQCQVVQNVFLVESNSVMNHGLICQVNIEKTKMDCFVFIACNINIIHSRFQGKASERNHVSHICSSQPGLRSDPWVRNLMLKVVLKNLFEKSQMIVQSDTFSRKSKCCDRIQKAGSQTSKSAVSKRWFRLNGLNLSKGFAALF